MSSNVRRFAIINSATGRRRVFEVHGNTRVRITPRADESVVSVSELPKPPAPKRPPRAQRGIDPNKPIRVQLRQALRNGGPERFIRFLINRGFFDDFDSTSDPD